MKKSLCFIIICFLILSTGCTNKQDDQTLPSSGNNEYTYLYSTKTNIHYTLPLNEGVETSNIYLGDVHPYFDESKKMLYLYYLDTSGNYQTKLITSFDGIKFNENKKFNVKYSIVPYSVLNVTKKNEYYSYFSDFQCSKSTDLINWEYLGKNNQIPINNNLYNGGMRDPSVIYEPTDLCFYAIGLAYKNINNQKLSNLIITKSTGDNNLSWESTFKEVFTEDQNSDYECPMLIKINNRWYIFASQYGKSNHGVGRLSYWIGDTNLNPYDINWKEKKEHYLTSEDLCAAQVFSMNNKFYLFGWVPQNYNNSNWGGSLNLLREVYSDQNGTLYTRIDEFLYSKIKKNKLYFKDNFEFNGSYTIDFNNDHYLIETSFTLKDNSLLFSFINSEYSIKVDKERKQIIVLVGDYICSKLDVDGLDNLCNLKIISEGNSVEVVLNDKYILDARIKNTLCLNEHLLINSNSCNFKEMSIYRLAYLEEL